MSTKIADVIVPEVFTPYVVNRTSELSALFQSGIITDLDDQLGIPFRTRGGEIITMPFFTDLTGAEEILSDTVPLTPGKISAAQDRAVVNCRGKAWGVHDLAVQLSGADPMGAIGDLVAGYWARRMQTQLISELKGIFAAASMAGGVSDISGAAGAAAVISGTTFVDAAMKLGDAFGGLVAIAIHSAAYALLVKNNLITFRADSEGRLTIPTYMGLDVLVDDGMPAAGGIYTSYLFGRGAIGYANAKNPALRETETDRDSLLGEDYLINRRYYVLHPRGVKWIGDAAGVSPTNTEFEDGDNWERVYEQKQIRIVQFKYKLA